MTEAEKKDTFESSTQEKAVESCSAPPGAVLIWYEPLKNIYMEAYYGQTVWKNAV